MFETEILGGSSSGINPIFNKNGDVKSLSPYLYPIFVFSQFWGLDQEQFVWCGWPGDRAVRGNSWKSRRKKIPSVAVSWAGWWLLEGDYQQGWQDSGTFLTTPGSAQPPGSRREKSQSSFLCALNVSEEQCGTFSGTDCGIKSFKKPLFRGSWAATFTWVSSELQIKPLPNQTLPWAPSGPWSGGGCSLTLWVLISSQNRNRREFKKNTNVILARGFCGSSWSRCLGEPIPVGSQLWLGALGVLTWVWGCLCELRPCSWALGGLAVITAIKCVSPHQSPAGFLLRRTRESRFLAARSLFYRGFGVWLTPFFPGRKPEGAGLFYQEMRMNLLGCCVSSGSFSLRGGPEQGLRLPMELGQSCCSGKGSAQLCRDGGTGKGAAVARKWVFLDKKCPKFKYPISNVPFWKFLHILLPCPSAGMRLSCLWGWNFSECLTGCREIPMPLGLFLARGRLWIHNF